MRNLFNMNLRVLFLALAFSLGLSGAAFAQEETSATVTGQVTDAAGAAVVGATVTVSDKATGFERKVQTNGEGNYTVTPLSPGNYTLRVEQSNFKAYVENVVLNAKDRRIVQVALEAGLPTETVTVSTDIIGVQDSPTVQGLVSGAQVRELPLVNRDFLKLLESGIPGISSDVADETSLGLTNRTSFSINGLRRNGINFLVDGVNNVDGGSNITLLSTPTIDSIAEFKVLTSNYTAEIGRSGGGVVTVVTRGGSNNFHGTLYEFARQSRFNANSFFNNRVPRRADGTRQPGTNVPRLRYNNFGGTISGPIYFPRFGEGGKSYYSGKNKTFFFYSEEVRRIRRGITATNALVPTDAQRRGDFSANLGLPLYLQANGSSGTTVTATPLLIRDTSGQSIQARVGQVFNPQGLAYAGNMIPSTDISPLALSLLPAYPSANNGTNLFTFSPVARQNTRQETFRIDHNFNENNRIFGRYTHDLNQTVEPGGLFNGINLPNVATTATNVPGQILAIGLTSVLKPTLVNEITYNFSQNFIGSNLIGKGRRSDYPGSSGIAEFYPENGNNAIPGISISNITFLGSSQGFNIRYRNNLFRDIVTYTHGNHTSKFGGEIAFEGKNENSSGNTQGSFSFTSLGSQGRSTTGVLLAQSGVGFASYLLGRADSYSEDQFDIRVKEHLQRREFFAQDTYKLRPNLTLDYGVRYQYFRQPFDENNIESSFIPALYSPSQVPTCANALCTSLIRGTGNELNGIVIAGKNSPYGRTIVPPDRNNFSPRVGFAYSPKFGGEGKTVIRGGYGFYYDQVATFLVEDPTFTNPPFVNSASFSGTGLVSLANPAAGALGNLPIRGAAGVSTNFRTPEIQQWSLGIQREIFKNAVLEVTYVGTKGDFLLDRRNINFVSPADTLAFFQRTGSTNVNSIRPFVGYSSVTLIETAAKSRYHGLLTSFNYRFGTAGLVSIAYTFSKNMTNFTNDRDGVDAPQNPLNLAVEYAEARSSRRHIFAASYIYDVPFFRNNDNRAVRYLLDGYQISGITNIESGQPISRILASTTNGGRNGNRSQLVGNPFGGLNGTTDPVTGLPYFFDPNAFADPALGTFGNSGRSIIHGPGKNQTNLRVSRNFYLNRDKGRYVQALVEAINAFNHTQFITTSINNQLGSTTTGLPSAARLPREFQFALKLYF